jgi:hypothetical protein
LSPYCKTHGACSRRAHQKGTHARIIPSRASSLGGPCPRLYHCHTHVQSFGFGAVVSHSPLSFCIGVRRGRPGTFLAGRHSTLSASTSSPARAHYQAFLPILFVRSHHPVRLETPGVPFFHRVPTTRVQCRAREACVPAILTCSPPRLRTLPWTALPVASTRAPAFGDRPKNYAMRSNEQRK